MRIEAPIVVKAELDNNEIMGLNKADEILALLTNEMAKRKFTECICRDDDGEIYTLTCADIIQASEVIETLTLLTEMQ